jgi:hypothetical protein
MVSSCLGETSDHLILRIHIYMGCGRPQLATISSSKYPLQAIKIDILPQFLWEFLWLRVKVTKVARFFSAEDVLGNLRRLQTVQDCPEGKASLGTREKLWDRPWAAEKKTHAHKLTMVTPLSKLITLYNIIYVYIYICIYMYVYIYKYYYYHF